MILECALMNAEEIEAFFMKTEKFKEENRLVTDEKNFCIWFFVNSIQKIEEKLKSNIRVNTGT